MSRHLAIELGDQYLKLSELSNGTVLHDHFFELHGRTADDVKDALQGHLDSSGVKSKEFDEVTLSWSSRQSTLVPANIFSDTTPSGIYKLCFGDTNGHMEIDYNRIAELDVVNIYSIMDWVKSFFVIRFPRIVIQHFGSHMVRATLKENAFYLKASVVLFADHFLLILSKHNNLEFYSFFDHQSAEDVIYHISFALQQKELDNEKGRIELISTGVSDDTLINDLKEMASKMPNLKNLEVIVNTELLAKSQLLCV